MSRITRLIAAYHVRKAKRIIQRRKAAGRQYIRTHIGQG